MKIGLFLHRYIPILLLSLTLISLAAVSSDTAYLNIDMTSQERNFIQVFWTEDGHYSTEMSTRIFSKTGRNTYSIPLENTFSIAKVRVDPQQGIKGKIPKPVEIHSMEYTFKWLFKGRQLNTEIEKLDGVKGIESEKTGLGSNIIVFTDEDPRLEFEMKMRPIFHQFFLPLFAFMGMHFLLSHNLLKEKRNRYLLEVIIGSDCQRALQDFIFILRKKKLNYKIIRSTIAGDLMRIQFQIDIQSAVLLRMLLQDPAVKKHLRSARCYAARSGEIS